MLTESEIKKQSEIASKEKFDDFMRGQSVRLLMSMIPASNPEILETLLKEAFTTGFDTGSGHTAIQIIKDVFSMPSKDIRRG